jgi:hypothetical protein
MLKFFAYSAVYADKYIPDWLYGKRGLIFFLNILTVAAAAARLQRRNKDVVGFTVVAHTPDSMAAQEARDAAEERS